MNGRNYKYFVVILGFRRKRYILLSTNLVTSRERALYENIFFSKIWGFDLLTWESLLDIQIFILVSNYAFFC